MRVNILAAMAIMGLLGCAREPISSDPLSLESEGPDASNVQQRLPLTVPATTALPVPTPGGTNLTDP